MPTIKANLGCYTGAGNFQFENRLLESKRSIDAHYLTSPFEQEIPEKTSLVKTFLCPHCGKEIKVETAPPFIQKMRQSLFPLLFILSLGLEAFLVKIALNSAKNGDVSTPGYWILVFFNCFTILVTMALALSIKSFHFKNTIRIISGDNSVQVAGFFIKSHKLLNPEEKF